MSTRVVRSLKNDSGQGLVEYALILALVAFGLVGILLSFRNAAGNIYNQAATQVDKSTACQYGVTGNSSQNCGSSTNTSGSSTTASGGGTGDETGSSTGSGSGTSTGSGTGNGNGNGNGNGGGANDGGGGNGGGGEG